MGRILTGLTEQVALAARPQGMEATAIRLFRLAAPLLAVLDGDAAMAVLDEVPHDAAPRMVLALFDVEPTPENLAQVTLDAYPMSRLQEVPCSAFCYRIYFMNLMAAEVERAQATYGQAAMETTMKDVKTLISSDVFRIWLPCTAEVVGHFDRHTLIMVTQSYLSIMTMAVRYAASGDVAAMRRLAPALRFMAQVVPIGFEAKGGYKLLALCRD